MHTNKFKNHGVCQDIVQDWYIQQTWQFGYFHNALLEIVLEVTLVLAINKKLLSRQIKIIKCVTYTVDIITMCISYISI